MPQVRYGVSPWTGAVPVTKRPEFPAYRAVSTAPVVIVGGGMAGAMTAYACAAAGVRPILLEADRIGQAGSGRATGFLSSEACESFRGLEARTGRSAARAMFALSARAPRELAATVKRLGIAANFDRRSALRLVPQGGADTVIRREIDDRRAAGVEASWLPPVTVMRQTAVPSAGAMRLSDWGFADPYRLTLGFLAAAARRGAQVFERSRVRKITFNRKNATALLDGGGAITTENLIICIGEPTDLFKALKRHLRHEDRYVVLTEPLTSAVRAELGRRADILCDTDTPAHALWFTKDHRALFAGGDQKRPPERLRATTLVQRTGQLMYELSRLYPAISGTAPAFGWDVPLAHPVDSVLYAGAHRNFPHHLFAFGTSHDPARAFLASRILLRGVIGKPEKEDEHFSFARNL